MLDQHNQSGNFLVSCHRAYFLQFKNNALNVLQGIFSGDVGRIKSQFLQAYGFHHLLTWEKARSMGLLSIKDSGLVVTREKNPLPLANFQLVSNLEFEFHNNI